MRDSPLSLFVSSPLLVKNLNKPDNAWKAQPTMKGQETHKRNLKEATQREIEIKKKKVQCGYTLSVCVFVYVQESKRATDVCVCI